MKRLFWEKLIFAVLAIFLLSLSFALFNTQDFYSFLYLSLFIFTGLTYFSAVIYTIVWLAASTANKVNREEAAKNFWYSILLSEYLVLPVLVIFLSLAVMVFIYALSLISGFLDDSGVNIVIQPRFSFELGSVSRVLRGIPLFSFLFIMFSLPFLLIADFIKRILPKKKLPDISYEDYKKEVHAHISYIVFITVSAMALLWTFLLLLLPDLLR